MTGDSPKLRRRDGGGADTKKHTGTPVAQELVQDPDLHMCSEMGGKGTGAL